MRQKYSKRSYYAFCWPRWLYYLKLCRDCKEILVYWRGAGAGGCFNAWKEYIQMRHKDKEAIKRRQLARMMNSNLVSKFLRWANYVRYCKKLRLKLKRLLHGPEFLRWVEFTQESKAMKVLARAASMIQAQVRCRQTLRRFKQKKVAKAKLDYFGLIVLSVRCARLIRDAFVAERFITW